MIQQSGVKLERRAPDFIKTTETLRPLRDHLIVKPLEWDAVKKGSKLVAIRHGSAVRGEVLAVGPGRYEKRYKYQHEKKPGERKFYTLKNLYIATEVKVGDIVELGGLELNGYGFPTILWGHTECIICQEQDVCMIRDDLSQRSR